MPYIKKENGRREALQQRKRARNAGELNYQIFYLVKHKKLKTYDELKALVAQFLGERPNYQKYNDMTGALIRCYREIFRRSGYDCRFLLKVLNEYDEPIADYEDEKCAINGDVE